jgi:hypothetical protein
MNDANRIDRQEYPTATSPDRWAMSCKKRRPTRAKIRSLDAVESPSLRALLAAALEERRRSLSRQERAGDGMKGRLP